MGAWAEAGLGAVETQSLVLIDYGPNGLALMKKGLTAKQALDSLLKADANNEGRQVAMVDTKGNIAAFCGSLYSLAFAAVSLGLLAPVGGAAFMAGWVVLALWALLERGD